MDYLKTERDGDGVVLLTLNRPDKLNVLNIALMDEMDELFRSFESDSDVKGVILTGSGEKAFAAGADIGELAALDRESGKARAQSGQALCHRVESFSRPVIAAINGYALGGGAELALACHLRVASREAEIGVPEITLGVIPGFGGTQRLKRLAGPARALELILTGDRIQAEEALRAGLVNRVSEPGQAVQEAKKLMKRILKNAPLAVTAGLRAVLDNTEDGFAHEAELFGSLCGTVDFQEGTRAFLEKRPATFRGR